MIETANIVGAGIGGLCAALALARNGVSVQVFEQAPEMAEVGAGLQLSPNAMKVLIALGLETELRSVSFEPENAVIRDGLSGRVNVSVPLRHAAVTQFGAPYLHIHRADLHRMLRNAAAQAGVTFQLGTRVEGYGAHGFNGLPAADVSIAADGVRSATSLQMNPKHPAQFTGQVAWRGAVPAADVPIGLIPADATVWAGPGKHVVTYYVRGGTLINFVAVEERDEWADAHWTTRGDIAQLRTVFSGWHSTVETLLGAATEANIWALYDKPELSRWSDGTVCLLGDACHPTLPFLAQGAAMAIEDSFVLSTCMKKSGDVRTALQRYEALRKPRTTMLQDKARKNAALFHQTGPLNGLIPKAKMTVAKHLPARLAMLPFKSIYDYDATGVDY